MRVTGFFLAILFLSGTLALCGEGNGNADDVVKEYVVKMTDNKFVNPDGKDVLKIAVGDRVKWANVGKNPHTATSDDIKTGDLKKVFNTATVKPGQHAVINFNKKGDYLYHCEYHRGMTGKISVE